MTHESECWPIDVTQFDIDPSMASDCATVYVTWMVLLCVSWPRHEASGFVTRMVLCVSWRTLLAMTGCLSLAGPRGGSCLRLMTHISLSLLNGWPTTGSDLINKKPNVHSRQSYQMMMSWSSRGPRYQFRSQFRVKSLSGNSFSKMPKQYINVTPPPPPPITMRHRTEVLSPSVFEFHGRVVWNWTERSVFQHTIWHHVLVYLRGQ